MIPNYRFFRVKETEYLLSPGGYNLEQKCSALDNGRTGLFTPTKI